MENANLLESNLWGLHGLSEQEDILLIKVVRPFKCVPLSPVTWLACVSRQNIGCPVSPILSLALASKYPEGQLHQLEGMNSKSKLTYS